ESIYEVIGTERDYVHDMRLIDTIFVEPLLRRDDIIPANTVGAKIWEIFYNYSEALQINDRLCAALCSLQEKHHTMPGIGGPFMEWTKNLEPLVAYSVHVPEAQAEIECEMARNPEFAKFVADAESHPDSRKLPLQSFVGRPAARLARYTLLLDAVLKHTPADNPDRALLPVVISKVKDVLARIDRLTGERANYVRIKKLRAQLKSGSGFDVRALCLDDPKRKLVHGGLLYQSDGQRVMTFLLDHVLLFAAEHKVAHAKGVSEYTVLREPVPIHLLDVISSADSAGGHSGHQSGGTATVGRRMLTRAGLLRPNTVASSLGGTSGSSGSPLPSCATPITFHKLGPNGWSQLLLAGNAQEREQWVEVVRKRIAADDMGLALDIALKPLSETDFIAPNAPLCSASFRSPTTGCMMVMFGAMDGL
ncbi:RHO1 GDP-GTP exchange protein 2, partial [Spiromyces aspiralis]